MSIYVVPRGGFGNILFIYMIGYAVAKKNSLKLEFIKQSYSDRLMMHEYELFTNCTYTNWPHNITAIKEEGFLYNELYINNQFSKSSHILDGYFQSYKYSNAYMDELKNQLFAATKQRLKPIFANLSNGKKTILVHVRRGDYLQKSAFHTNQSNEYYQMALGKFDINADVNDINTNIKLMIFSDDIEFVKTWPLLIAYDHVIVDSTDIIDTFVLMSMCDNFIIANSTYSLLAYYFRDNKDAKLCIPEKWFGEEGPKFNINDLVEVTDNVFVI